MVEGYGKMAVALWVGDTLYDPSHLNYIPVVTRFAFSDTKAYHELPIQSYVAQPISERVIELYSQFLAQHQADIQLKFEEELEKNFMLEQTVYNIIRDEMLSRCVKITRAHVANMVVQAMQTSVVSQVSMTATQAAAQHVAVASTINPAAGWVVGGLALYKILTLPRTLGKKLGVDIQTILNGNFGQWTDDVLQRAFEDLIDPKKFMKSVGGPMLDSVVVTGVQDAFGNPVDVGELKDDVDLIKKIAEEVHIIKPGGPEKPPDD